MEKTFRFLSMAALLVVGAIMTGCSNDDNMDIPQQPANKDNVVTLTATVSLDGGDGMRAVDGSTGAKTFESTNKIAVVYKDGESNTLKAESGALTLSNDDKTATFTVTLTNPATDGAIRYIYPATMAKTPATDATITDDDATIDYSGLFGSQDGTLATIANYDLAVFDGALSGTDLPTSTTLANKLAICKFKLTYGVSPTDFTSTVNSLTVSDGTNTYAISPSGLSEIYVAMKPVTGKNIAFTASTSASKTYFKTSGIKTLAASKLYTDITVAMQELAVGKVIGKDGIIYNDADDAGANAAAVIVYLGSDNGEAAPYNHGLALALSDANGGSRCKWKTSQADAGHTKQTSDTFTEESGLQYNAMHNSEIDNYPAFKAAIANNGTAAPTGCSAWFLASGYQWKKMAGAAGLSGFYWSSSELDASKAWAFNSGNGNWFQYNKDITINIRVRSCLAF